MLTAVRPPPAFSAPWVGFPNTAHAGHRLEWCLMAQPGGSGISPVSRFLRFGTDPEQRRLIEKLLLEEEAKLKKYEEDHSQERQLPPMRRHG